MPQGPERRRFIRHPICYPLEFERPSDKLTERSHTRDIGEGGLMFLSTRRLDAEEVIILKLPLQNKLFKVKAKVEHVSKNKENNALYDVGVSFYRHSDAFKVKLIEQIYLIDEYRALRAVALGRDISFMDASDEWIKHYSERFDRLFWGRKRGRTKGGNKGNG
ncbi:MAG: PilZ domain-containing protein [Candidatus Omnitrophota bacterium]